MKATSIVSKDAEILYQELRERLIYTIELLSDITPANALDFKDPQEQPIIHTANYKNGTERILCIEANPIRIVTRIYQSPTLNMADGFATHVYGMNEPFHIELSVDALISILKAIENYFHKPLKP